jgi:hypothetical protein
MDRDYSYFDNQSCISILHFLLAACSNILCMTASRTLTQLCNAVFNKTNVQFEIPSCYTMCNKRATHRPCVVKIVCGLLISRFIFCMKNPSSLSQLLLNTNYLFKFLKLNAIFLKIWPNKKIRAITTKLKGLGGYHTKICNMRCECHFSIVKDCCCPSFPSYQLVVLSNTLLACSIFLDWL